MKHHVTYENEHLLVDLSGKLYTQDATELREELLKYIDGGAKWVNLNVSELTYIDSSGLSLLVTIQKSLQNLICSP